MEFFQEKHWSGLPFPPPGDLPDLGIKPRSSPALQADFFFFFLTVSATSEENSGCFFFPSDSTARPVGSWFLEQGSNKVPQL